jgi:hypothetical protein
MLGLDWGSGAKLEGGNHRFDIEGLKLFNNLTTSPTRPLPLSFRVRIVAPFIIHFMKTSLANSGCRVTNYFYRTLAWVAHLSLGAPPFPEKLYGKNQNHGY